MMRAMPEASPDSIDRKPHPLHRAQAAGARLLYGLVRLLPFETASDLGGWLARTLGPRLSISDRARRNLRRAFPEKDAAEIEAIVRGMWDNLGRTAFEYAHLDKFRFFDPADGRIEVIGAENIDLVRDDGKAGIFFSGHLANWELMGLCAAARGLPVHLVYRAPNNPHMDWLFALRRSGNAELVPKGPAGARRTIELLKRGGHLGMLVDQKMNDGIPVPFFGRDAMTAPALAQFVLKLGIPAVPARVERLGGPRFRITVHPPLQPAHTGDHHADMAALMGQVNALLEAWIRERPDQWFWLHRRWPD
jgi:KDO2-lipid IV(A) lauroyltransferase